MTHRHDPRRRQLGLAAVSGLALGAFGTAQAQTPAWPAAKPIRMIVNFPAGGSPDLVARAVSNTVSQALGQQIVVDNRGGAGGVLGNDAVAKAAPRELAKSSMAEQLASCCAVSSSGVMAQAGPGSMKISNPVASTTMRPLVSPNHSR